MLTSNLEIRCFDFEVTLPIKVVKVFSLFGIGFLTHTENNTLELQDMPRFNIDRSIKNKWLSWTFYQFLFDGGTNYLQYSNTTKTTVSTALEGWHSWSPRWLGNHIWNSNLILQFFAPYISIRFLYIYIKHATLKPNTIFP